MSRFPDRLIGALCFVGVPVCFLIDLIERIAT